MKASVVIPTHNREKILNIVLRYYGGQGLSKDIFEVIIVDDGSTDQTFRLFNDLKDLDIDGPGPALRKYRGRIKGAGEGWYRPENGVGFSNQCEPLKIKYIQIEKSGRSVSRNIGIWFSSYPLTIFADDDIFVEPDFVKKHIESHTPHDSCVIMGRVIHTRDIKNPFSAGWKLKDINTAFLATGNASVFKEYLIQAGLFDEGYTVYGWEDFDLGIHLKEIGVKSQKRKIYGYHYDPPQKYLEPERIYGKEKERGSTAVYFYKNHPLRWVERFTLVNNRILKTLFRFLGFRNWFLSKKRISFLKGFFRLVIRFKGYFDGIDEGKENYSG